MICCDFQQLGWVIQAMDFIQDNVSALDIVQKTLRVLHEPAHSRQLAVKIDYLFYTFAEAGFSDAAHAGNPKDGTLPLFFKQLKPESPAGDGFCFHGSMYTIC
jgi:hypothetical protein